MIHIRHIELYDNTIQYLILIYYTYNHYNYYIYNNIRLIDILIVYSYIII